MPTSSNNASDILWEKGCKLRNRRVFIARRRDGDFRIVFHKYLGGRDIKKTSITLTSEAACVLCSGLNLCIGDTEGEVEEFLTR